MKLVANQDLITCRAESIIVSCDNLRGDPTATQTVNRSQKSDFENKALLSFEEAMNQLSRDDRFRATVYAMNTLMVQRGIYSPAEFEWHFREFASKNQP